MRCGTVRRPGGPFLSLEQSMINKPPAWEVVDVTKRFAGVVACKAVSLRLRAGEIHGLVGENGSGKSTLIKMLAGAHQPDDGKILKGGVPVVLPDPSRARSMGVATV